MQATFLRKGLIDTALQVGATVGVRFALVFAMFALSPFVSIAEIATYDLFIVASSVLLIFLTLGLDSGLAVVANSEEGERQSSYLWVALALSALQALVLYAPLKFVVESIDLGILFNAKVFTIAYLYAIANAVMTVVFSFYRWQGKSQVASLIIIAANCIGFTGAIIAFWSQRTVFAFVDGLLYGSAVGVLATLFYVQHRNPYPAMLRSWVAWYPLLSSLLHLSWPFGLASLALIARRSIDRFALITFGTPSLLGAYALVSRAGEMISFLLSLPALGFTPIVLQQYKQKAGQQLALLMYNGYFTVSVLIIASASALWFVYGSALFPTRAQHVSSVFLALLAGNLFFAESMVAGFSFVIVQRTLSVAWLSIMFIAVNLAVTVPLSLAGFALEGVATGFLIASLVHSSLFIYLSEKKLRFGYPLRTIVTIKIIMTVAIIGTTFIQRNP